MPRRVLRVDFALTLAAIGPGGVTLRVDSRRSRGLVLDEMARRRHASADDTVMDLCRYGRRWCRRDSATPTS